jgi:hypothetical protein
VTLVVEILMAGTCWFGLGFFTMYIADHRAGYEIGREVRRWLGVSPYEAILLMVLAWPVGLLWACVRERRQ